MLAVKVSVCWQRFPALSLSQFVSRSQITIEHLPNYGVESDVDKTLIKRQHILNHMTVQLGLFVAIEIVPPKSFQSGGECALHPRELRGRNQVWNNNNAVLFQLMQQALGDLLNITDTL